MHRITMLGTGLIGMFYTMALHSHRRRDRVHVAYSRSPDRAKKFAARMGHPAAHDQSRRKPSATPRPTSLSSPCRTICTRKRCSPPPPPARPSSCTKPLGRNAAEAAPHARRPVEKAGVFHGYLEDLCYTPKTLKALEAGAPRRARQDPLGPLARNPLRPAQRLVLEQGALRRRRDRRPRLPLHRDRPQLHRQRHPPRRSHAAGATRRSIRSKPRTTPSAWCATRTARSASSR